MNKLTKAKIPVRDISNGSQPENKELVAAYSLIMTYKRELREAVTVRVYMGRSSSASMVYACVWIRGVDGTWNSGRGSAGGYGYHKESESIARAFDSAGVQLFGSPHMRDDDDNKIKRMNFGGTGSSYYREIFTAVARAAGYRGKSLLVSH